MSKLEEYPLEMYDTPKLMRFLIKGSAVNPVGVAVRDNKMFLQVEIIGEDQVEHDVRVEAHGTGWPIPNAEDITYIGTGIVYSFVWHVFYTIHIPGDKEVEENESDTCRIYTIYKYPVKDNGEVDIETEHRIAKELYRGMQYGRQVAWVLLECGEEMY